MLCFEIDHVDYSHGLLSSSCIEQTYEPPIDPNKMLKQFMTLPEIEKMRDQKTHSNNAKIRF